MKRLIKIISIVFLFGLLAFAWPGVEDARAADTVCAKVSLEIAQELTLERGAFDAKLVITNNLTDKALTDVRVDIYLKDLAGNIKNDIFFVKLSSVDNMAGIAADADSIDGTGIVAMLDKLY
jgi:hypothetical protein